MRMDRREFVVGLGAAALGAAVSPVRVGWARGWGVGEETWFSWEEVREGVHVGIGEGGNAMVVRTGEGVVLVDTKSAPFGPTIRREAEARGGGAVRLVINTHHHADHTGGNCAFAGVQRVMHAAARDRIAGQLERYREAIGRGMPAGRGERAGREAVAAELSAQAARAGSLKAEDFAPGSGVPGEFLSGMPMPVGGVTLALYHFGAGHTDNDVVVEVRGANVVHAGDLFFNGRHPFFDPGGGVSARGWVRAVERTLELCDGETVVIPGHGPVSDAAGLRVQLAYLREVVDAVGDAVAAGKTREEVVGMTLPCFEGLAGAQLRGRVLGTVFDELSGEASGGGGPPR